MEVIDISNIKECRICFIYEMKNQGLLNKEVPDFRINAVSFWVWLYA